MRLSDCFVDLIAYVTYAMENRENLPGGCDALYARLEDLIRQSEMTYTKHDFSREDYDLARFAVFVWIDETIMKSTWESKGGWTRKLLQRAYYKTTDGGVEFYRKLDALELEKTQVREVYFMCLTLGYSGRFGITGDDVTEREGLKSQNLKRLTGTTDALSVLSREKVFPDAYPAGESVKKTGGRWAMRGSFMAVVLGIGPVGIFVFLYVLYHFILNNEIMTKLAH